MTFNDCVIKFSESTGRTKTESKVICNQILGIIMDTLLSGEEISIYGFGSMKVQERTLRPMTGFDGIKYPERKKNKVVFSPSESFERRLNENAHKE